MAPTHNAFATVDGEIMNILILDFDGVINTFCPHPGHERIYVFDQHLDDKYVPCLAKNVAKLCKKYDLKIVVSSAWREYYKFYELEHILKYMKIDAELIDITTSYTLDDNYDKNRGRQVQNWTSNNEHDLLLILDDNRHAGYMNESFFVLCDKNKGFDDEAFAKAEIILDSQIKLVP